MKKILTLLLVLTMLACFAACDEKTEKPSATPSEQPTGTVTSAPTEAPTDVTTQEITQAPTVDETVTNALTAEPTAAPTAEPTATPTAEPTATPTAEPTAAPTAEPTAAPTAEPTAAPTAEPTAAPTAEPTEPAFDKEKFGESLWDPALMYFLREDNSYNGNVYIAPNLLKYGDYAVTRWDMVDFTMDISADEYYQELAKHLVFDDALLNEMKQARNNADTYTVEYQSTPSMNFEVLGYVHKGENKYTAYYLMYDVDVWEVELEYNEPDKPNRYSSIVKIDALPDNIEEF